MFVLFPTVRNSLRCSPIGERTHISLCERLSRRERGYRPRKKKKDEWDHLRLDT